MLNCIYDIFLTCDKNDCPDLVVMAQPMFLSDARTGSREYVADETDIDMWHEHAVELDEQASEVAKFIGRHYDALVDAFKFRDRAAFDAVVDDCIKADEEDAEKDGDAGEDE